jgi:enediyne polyketide synthase
VPGIAIVGMACRYPDARTPAELWENVLAQRRSFRRMPAERMRIEDYFSPDRNAADSTYSCEAALIEGYEFDRVRFKISGSQYRSADLAHWLALDIATQALTDAGFEDGKGLPKESTGVLLANTLTGDTSRANVMRLRWPYVRRVVGSTLAEQGWTTDKIDQFLADLESSYKEPFPAVNEETLAGGLSNTIAGRICNHFDLKGGGYTLDGACAASLLAVSNACSALVAGDLEIAIAGGVDLSIDPFELVGFAKAGALAEHEMRVYDKRSAGFWPGEGCGFVVLMREEQARAENRKIHAVIRGWGISSDGSGGITRPEPEGQLLALKRAYARAGFGIDTVGYFEGHGTGTSVGDATELGVLTSARRSSGARNPAAIGSIKANIGHCKAAAGLAGLLKATMALREGVIPPITGCNEPHALLADKGAALRAPRVAEEWSGDGSFRAAVSAMGFGGLNTHVVLEGPRGRGGRGSKVNRTGGAQDAELFAFVASTVTDLKSQIERVQAYAGRLSRAELIDLASHLAVNRQTGDFRAAVVAGTPAELDKRLDRLLTWLMEGVADKLDLSGGVFLGHGASAPKIGFLFPGQGCPAQRSGGAWRHRFAKVAELYDAAELPLHGDEIQTDIAQPAIVTAELAALRILKDLGIDADIALGHSLGELTALHWAGAFDEQSLIRIARTRGRAMADCRGPAGGMAAIAAPASQVEQLMSGTTAVIASFNTPQLTVVSGALEVIIKIISRAEAEGVRATRLKVSHAFHSPLVAAASGPLADQLARENTGALKRKVASTITGAELPADVNVSDLLIAQLTTAVQFTQAVRLAAQDADLLIEVGPGRVLGGLVEQFIDKPVVSTDACSDSFAGLLRAAGAAFALGANVKIETLFDNRFTRPFNLDWRPKFITNPCEAAPIIHVSQCAKSNHCQAALDSATQTSDFKPQASGLNPFDVVQRLVAARAELPIEVIKESSRLLGDLHLNSIVVGQLAVEASRELGLPPPVAPSDYATATVGSIAQALADLALTNADGKAPPRIPAGVDTWVRPFVVEWRKRPMPAMAQAQRAATQTAQGWRVIAHPQCPFKAIISERLASAGTDGGVVVCVPPKYVESSASLFLDGARAAMEDRQVRRVVIVQDAREHELPGGLGAEAFARTLHLEAPQLDVCVVHVPTQHPDAVDWVMNETVGLREGFHETRFDSDGNRFAPVLKPIELRPAHDQPLSPDDVLLVTGGGKGIAAECALTLAQEYGVKLALLGRSDPGKDRELAENLRRFESAGVTFRYFATDVIDTDAVRSTVTEVERTIGPVTAFIHGAGTNTPRLLNKLEKSDFNATVLPKVQGARNVLSAVDPSRLKLFVAFGSLIARAGMPGEADYAVANDWLASLAERWQAEHPHCRTLALEWSVWSGVGMGERLGRVDALAQQGITPIPPDTGIDILKRLLTAETPVRVVVCGRFGESSTLQLDGPPLPFQRFLESPRVYYPGVELVVDSTISSSSDPYLEDHVFHGERLFPAVLGLEAMAQAAMALTNEKRLPRFENVELTRPIAVPRDGQTEIRIAALVREPGRVEVAVRCDQSGFAVDHFRAICVFEEQEIAATRLNLAELPGRLSLDPQKEVYGPLLFHTGRFMKVAAYRELSALKCLAELRDDMSVDGWFGSYLPPDLILGDPASRDATIHAIQPCIPHATILPTGIERVSIFAARPEGAKFVRARERSHAGSDFIYDLEVFAAGGELLETWDGLQLRAVESKTLAEPLPEELLAPCIERRISEYMPQRNIRVAVARNGDLPRQAASTAAMKATFDAPAAITRRADGKPVCDNGRFVSAAHAGEWVLAVSDDRPTGCDIESITPRDEALWRSLLGESRFQLARFIASEAGEDLNTAATRVWSALESVRKAGLPHDAPLIFDAIKGHDWILLRAGAMIVATIRITVANAPNPLIIAVAGQKTV